MKKEIILKGKKCTIRQYRLSDISEISAIGNNKKISHNLFNGFPSPYTKEEAEKWVKLQIEESLKNKHPLIFVIESDGKVAGDIGAGNIENGKITFGYWLGEEFWG